MNFYNSISLGKNEYLYRDSDTEWNKLKEFERDFFREIVKTYKRMNKKNEKKII